MPTIQPSNQPLPLRVGDRVRTLPCSGDDLKGRITAVYRPAHSPPYYRVRFPAPSPYFFDEGVVYRAHEIADAETPDTVPKIIPNPKRPLPYKL